MAESQNRGDMPFLDHLEELRWRLLKSLLAVAIGTAVGWFLVQHFDVLGLLKRPIAPFLPDGKLVFTSPTEPLILTLKLAFVVGLVGASPVLVYQTWAFLAPALYERERRVIGPAFTVGILLFLGGAFACYRWVLPATLDVLFGFQRNDLAAFITVDRYFSFATQLIVAFGVVAELPLVVTILAAFGVVTPQFLARHRRYAIVIAAVVAAFLTPPDALSMLLMLGPLLLLYEVSILGAWLVTRRRARRADGTRTAALVLCLAVAAAGGAKGLDAQTPARADSVRAARRMPPDQRDTLRAGRPVDTAAARRLGLPTGPTRTFPAADPVLDSLLGLPGYRVTRFVADTLVVEGESQTILLRGEAFVDRDGTKLEADSIRYREASCRLDAYGNPRLFDRTTALVGDQMRYDTCLKRGVVVQALTDFRQGGATWYMRGNLAVDSNSTRLYGASSEVTTCELPVPHYHFAAREVKWIHQGVMVARPAVLFIRDVPILWLPFIVQDTRSGRRSGILVPRFGLNDLVRQGRGYQRHVANIGYYFVLNNYSDLLISSDWYAGRSVTLRGQGHYRWLNRFITGGVSYSRLEQFDDMGSSSQIVWHHNQSFDSRTQLNVSLNYATSASVLSRNTVNPLLATAQLTSNGSFSKRFSWGTVTVGASRSQNLQNDQVSQTFPNISLTPAPVNITPAITWSPGFSLVTTQTFHNGPTLIPIPGPAALADTFAHFFDDRTSNLSFGTPLRVGRWNWSNTLSVTDRLSSQRQTFLLPDSTVPGGARRVLYDRTFSTAVEWQTGINLPQLFSGTWRLQPGLSIVNTTSAGPFMLRNQFSNGVFVRQGKRLQVGLGLRPTLFAFFPGVGPWQRLRHTFSPLIDYRYAPGALVPEEYARALDPEQTNPNVRSDPQQTISFGLAQNFEAKLRPAPGDSAEPRKIRILGLATSAIGYNFEQATQAGRTGWTTQSLTNTVASDLLAGFTLQVTHDLWRGLVGIDTSRFEPFLQSVSASFAVTPATLHGIGALFGVGRRRAPPAVAAPDDTTLAGGANLGGPLGFGPPAGGSRGFSLGLNYTSTRTRDGTALFDAGGQQSLNVNLSFSPTPSWQARWSATYDVDLQRFNQHVVQLERDLHRWHASFGFTRTATGSSSFTFLVALRDQPDIKFDYDQQTFVQ